MIDMKKFAYILLIALSATLVSCGDDFLESESPSTFDESVVFSNYTLAEYNVFSISETFGHTNNYRGRFLPWYGFNTDAEWYVSTTSDAKSEIATYGITTNNSQLNLDNGPFSEMYAGIERANICIKGLRAYGNVDKNADMAYLLGEALTLRAMIYFDMIKAWGDVPARFEPISPETIYLPKSDRDVIYKQILADLKEAKDYLPYAATTAQTMRTDRVSKEFAVGLYARIALAAAGYAQRPDDGMVGTGNIGSRRLSVDPALNAEALYGGEDGALAMLEEVINGSNCALYEDYEQLWKDFNNFSNDNLPAGKEVLFVIPFGDSRGRWNYTFAVRTDYNGSGRGGTVGPAPSLFFDYKKEDSRRNVSCVNYKFEKDGVIEPAGIENWYFGKFRFQWQTNHPYTGGNDDGVKPVVMRWSDILLMAAEMANELNQLDKAQGYFQQVRERATDATEAAAYIAENAANKADMLEAIKEERKLEFVGEFLRKGDLIRWNELGAKVRESVEDYLDLKNTRNDYAHLNPEGDVWYRVVEGGIEFCGFDGERVQPEGKEWKEKGEYITKKVDSSNKEIMETKAASVITAGVDPDDRQYWPIFDANAINAQGCLVNDYGYTTAGLK